MKDNKGQVIAALDIGSTKVVVAVARLSQGEVEVIGVGKSENRGVKQGQIVAMDLTQQAIQEAKEEAELLAGVKLSDVYLAVSGESAKCISTTGMVPIRQKAVDKQDIKNVLSVARAVHVPESSHILHIVPSTYTVDGQEGIENPEGMQGVRLEVQAQLITISEKSVTNLVQCVEKSGLKIRSLVLGQYASTLAVVGTDERELGLAVADMGGGTCDLIVYREGSLAQVGSIPVGGLNFTQDVAVGIKTPLMNAELIKKKYGTAMVDMVGEEENVSVEGLGERKTITVSRSELCRILEARAEETLSLIFQKLNDWDVIKDLGAGVILTGGASQLQGLVELGEFTFDVPVRRGFPNNGGGIKETYSSPIFATVLGTLLYGFEEEYNPKVRRTPQAVAGAWDQFKNLIGKSLSI